MRIAVRVIFYTNIVNTGMMTFSQDFRLVVSSASCKLLILIHKDVDLFEMLLSLLNVKQVKC